MIEINIIKFFFIFKTPIAFDTSVCDKDIALKLFGIAAAHTLIFFLDFLDRAGLVYNILAILQPDFHLTCNLEIQYLNQCKIH